jgi:hypothetical protein
MNPTVEGALSPSVPTSANSATSRASRVVSDAFTRAKTSTKISMEELNARETFASKVMIEACLIGF